MGKKFWTFGSLVGKKRKIVELKSERERHQSNLDHKIRSWKISEQEIAKIDAELEKLESEVDNK